MKAEETRRNLINELNAQFAKTGSFFATSETPDDPVVTFPSPTFEKPKMFEPKKMGKLENISETTEIPEIRGIGFKDNTTRASVVKKNVTTEKRVDTYQPQEIYNMKELINSHPENMRTLSYDTKTVKAQFALVKKKEWQDILFDDVDWFKPIDFSYGFKKIFKL